MANSKINLAQSTWNGTQALAFAELESDVATAQSTAESTITSLQSQAAQAWTDYLATLAPGEMPKVTQQPVVSPNAPSASNTVTTTLGQMSAFQANLTGLPIGGSGTTLPSQLDDPVNLIWPAGLPRPTVNWQLTVSASPTALAQMQAAAPQAPSLGVSLIPFYGSYQNMLYQFCSAQGLLVGGCDG